MKMKQMPAPERLTEEEYELRLDEMLARLPPELRPAVSWHAWQHGHSGGYEEVLLHAEDMVDALEAPVKALAARLQGGGPLLGPPPVVDR